MISGAARGLTLVEAARQLPDRERRPRLLQRRQEWHVSMAPRQPVLVNAWGGASSSLLSHRPAVVINGRGSTRLR